jgi:hypothetical protein
MKQTLKIGITIVVVAALTMSGIALARTGDEASVGEGASRGVAAIVQRLGPLVEAGTIDQDQAQAVAETLADGMAFRRPQQPRPVHGLRAAAEFLGMEVDDLGAQLRGGATLEEIAGDQTGALIDALVAEIEEHLAQAVADGRLPQGEADTILADAEERITMFVNEGPPERPEGERPRRPRRPGGPGGDGPPIHDLGFGA